MAEQAIGIANFINDYIYVTGEACTVDMEGWNDSAVITVSGLGSKSRVRFSVANENHPLPSGDWFTWDKGFKNAFFDASIQIIPTGKEGVQRSWLTFTAAPDKENTNGAAGVISAGFQIENVDGLVNRGTLRLVW